MTLCEVLASLARKLGLTEHEVVILYLFNRTGVSKAGLVRAMHILNRLVDSYGLLDESDSPTYGEQLYAKGILTEFEGSILSGTDEVVYIAKPPPVKRRKRAKTK